MNETLREALASVINLASAIPHSVDVEQAGMQAEVVIATARAALASEAAPASGEGYWDGGGRHHPALASTATPPEPGLDVERRHPFTCEWCDGEWSDWRLYDAHFGDLTHKNVDHPYRNPALSASPIPEAD